MRKFWIGNLLLIGFLICFLTDPSYSQQEVGSQLDLLHGDQNYSTYGVHSGNLLRTFFWNDGQIGRRKNLTSIDQVGGEWPINSGHITLAKIATWFGSEVRGTDGVIRHIVSESNGTWTGDPGNHSSGDADIDTGEWWTMTPLPGFYNPSPPQEETDLPWVAMSHKGWSWPALWPDKMVDPGDPGWPGSWDGYFGKNLFNADQESFYMMDDWHNKEFPFYPDANDSTRRGLGFRVTVRGFQWSHLMVEDMIFWLFDCENIGTHLHDKVAFGIMCGPDIGSDGDSSDDGGAYDLLLDLGYQFDNGWDNGTAIGENGYTPVEILGLAFLESPGNPYDGIDNDGDGMDGSGPTLPQDVNTFATRTVNAGDQIIMINYNTFARTVTEMPASGAVINYLGREQTILPGVNVEIENDLIDNNLNGLIDENNGSIYGTGDAAVDRRLYAGLKYIDYFTDAGKDNPLIDEERDDGEDNDGDWNVLFDDVGLDGVPETLDEGEGDGLPTSGAGKGRPGEPHIDVTDIDESDMIGLTSFFIYTDFGTYALSNDENMWVAILPGVLNAIGQIANTDVILGSGYFPIKPGETERFSFSYMYGYPFDDLVRNKQNGQSAYAANYNFSKAPEIPTVNAFAEDGKVTLYWDDFAEESYDPLTGYDFEGYRIYRSTDQEWNDMAIVTDGYGTKSSNRKPLAQFDLDNGITGFSRGANNGVQFYFGDDTGLVHSWTDSSVTNGQSYYYAVTAFDRGLDSTALYPSECSRYLSINKTGAVDKGRNVVIVKPEAPAAGFVGPKVEQTWLSGTTTNAQVQILFLDKTLVQEKTYRITFEDTLIKNSLWLYPMTTTFSLLDVTTGAAPDSIIKKSRQFGSLITIPGNHEFNLILQNKASLAVNADSSVWTRSNIFLPRVRLPYVTSAGIRLSGTPMSADYRVEIGEPGSNSSSQFYDFASVPVNFKVTNVSMDKEVEFAFEELDGSDGLFSAFTQVNRSDRIYFLEKDQNDSLIITWQFELSTSTDTTLESPQPGDVCNVILEKPFLSHDVLEFKTKPAMSVTNTAKADLEKIKVVPNPYVVANSWEPRNQYSTGRGPRELHFTHLPQKCTIRIFNVRGQLVRTLEHNASIWDGAEVWDMLTKDKLDIAFGVYVYHIDAPGIGSKIGKFAVIK
ncbi:hypothetical protein A2V82_06900 [candidate division KSB1 bacterium RBG_16_48_16]|nr:MAG: hypothetical protein A2V82_06900 [candidate division KSB1 bacterium RBG_16_48_16]